MKMATIPPKSYAQRKPIESITAISPKRLRKIKKSIYVVLTKSYKIPDKEAQIKVKELTANFESQN